MKSKETKIGSGNTALKAGVWYVISSIMVKAISIITTPIFTRMLSTSEYGTVSTFTSWSGLLLTFFTLNLTYSIGRAKLDYPDKLDDYVGSMQLLSLLVSSVICYNACFFEACFDIYGVERECYNIVDTVSPFYSSNQL